MGKYAYRTLKGFRDFLPQEKRKRDFVENQIRSVFVKHGFLPIETPTLESENLLLGKYGAEAEKLIYSFEDKGNRRIGLRYDQTIPGIRFFGNNASVLPTYFRRYQIQNVFRAEKPQKGRYREFKQCDADIFNAKEGVADAEILACTFDVFQTIGIKDIKILFNDRRSLINVVKPYSTSDVSIASIIQSIDKLDKTSQTDVVDELTHKGLDRQSAEECLLNVLKTDQSEELKRIFDMAIALGVSKNSLVFSPQLARGLDYYTGMIFEVVLDGVSGSFAGGGRYDHIATDLINQDIPAVGVGLGFDRIVDFLDRNSLINLVSNGGVFVTVFSNELRLKSLEIASILRNVGVVTEVFVGELKTISKQLKYANKIGYKYVVIIGDNENKNNTVVIKNMESSEQYTVKSDCLSEWVKDNIKGKALI